MSACRGVVAKGQHAAFSYSTARLCAFDSAGPRHGRDVGAARAERSGVVLSARTARFSGSVGPLGDSDGDHRADLLGYPDDYDNAGDRNRVLVIRGRRFSAVRRVAPQQPASGHLLIEHPTGRVFATGDVNGDGLADALIAAGFGPDHPTTGAVIFGSPSSASVDPDQLGSRGFRYGVPSS
jgi:hypothetical protein